MQKEKIRAESSDSFTRFCESIMTRTIQYYMCTCYRNSTCMRICITGTAHACLYALQEQYMHVCMHYSSTCMCVCITGAVHACMYALQEQYMHVCTHYRNSTCMCVIGMLQEQYMHVCMCYIQEQYMHVCAYQYDAQRRKVWE